MGKCYKEADTIGKRIAKYRKQQDMTMAELAKAMNTSRQLVDKWEHDQRDCLPYLERLCEVLEVEKNQLLFGISTENLPIYADLGLSDIAIEELRRLNRFPKRKYSANIYLGETFSGETEPEGYSPEENLHMVNLLLSTVQGAQLLSLLYRYCFADFTTAYLHNENTAYLDKEDSESDDTIVDFLSFPNNSSTTGKTIIDVSLMRYAIMKGIESTADELAKIVKGGK